MPDPGSQYQSPKITAGLAGLTDEQIEVARVEAARQRISVRESILKLVL